MRATASSDRWEFTVADCFSVADKFLCIVSETLRSYADSYNEVSAAATLIEFGRDIFKECAEVASKNWESQRAIRLAKE